MSDGSLIQGEERLDRIMAALANATRRFPLALLGVTLWTTYALWSTLLGGPQASPFAGPGLTIFLCALALIGLDGGTRLLAERLDLSARRHWAIKLGGIALSLLAIGTGPQEVEAVFLAVALLLPLGLLSGPGRAGEDVAYWRSSVALVVRLGVAGGMAAVLLLGLGLLSLGIQILLGFDSEKVIESAVILCAFAFAPLFAMAAVPEGGRLTPAEVETRLLGFLGAVIAVPLCAAYLLLIYIQGARFLAWGEIPANATGWLVSVFGTLGILTWMATAGIAETARLPHVRLYRRVFFPALIVPAGLLAVALMERVDAFGWTPERVALAAVTVWFALSILWWLTRRWTAQNMRAIPALLALVLVGASVGPLSMTAVAERSQTARLESALRDAGLLTDNGLSLASRPVDQESLRPIASALAALNGLGDETVPLPWPTTGGKTVTVGGLANAMDIPLASAGVRSVPVHFTDALETGLTLPENAAMLQAVHVDEAMPAQEIAAGNSVMGPVRLSVGGGVLTVAIGAEERRFTAEELAGLTRAELVADGRPAEFPPRSVVLATAAGTVTLHPRRLRFDAGAPPALTIREADLLVILGPPQP